MAAKDCAAVQEFPRASFPVPSQKVLEELSALNSNVSGGQQSAGQSADDPYTRAVKYVERHRIVEVFQVVCVRNHGHSASVLWLHEARRLTSVHPSYKARRWPYTGTWSGFVYF